MQLFDRFPLRYVLPNAVTCTSVLLGLASVRISMTATTREDFVRAAWLIMYTVLLDKLDGTVARAVKASSEIGVQLDSFSDFVTFGIAPAALITQFVFTLGPEEYSQGPLHLAALAAGALYVLAAVVRLAKFNVTTGAIGPDFFLGLPSTSSGGILSIAFLTHQEFRLPDAWLPGFLVALVLNGVLMVCNLPQPKLKISKNPVWRTIQILAVISVYVFVPLHFAPAYLLLISSGYTIGGFIYGVSVGGPTPPRTQAPEVTA